MSQKQIFSLDLSVLVNSKIGTLRDETLLVIDSAEIWLNGILNQSQAETSIKKKRCEVCYADLIFFLRNLLNAFLSPVLRNFLTAL